MFGLKLRAELTKAIAALDPKDQPRGPKVAKYIAILCFAATEPVQAHRDTMLTSLSTLCAAWQERAAQAAAAAAAGGVTEGDSRGATTAEAAAAQSRQNALVHRPEYSIFFVIYLVSHHEDFPLDALMHSSADSSTIPEEVCLPGPRCPQPCSCTIKYTRSISSAVHRTYPRTYAASYIPVPALFACQVVCTGDMHACITASFGIVSFPRMRALAVPEAVTPPRRALMHCSDCRT